MFDELLNKIEKILKQKDNLVLHIDGIVFYQLSKNNQNIIKFFENLVKILKKKNGTLIIPTFTYSFCNNKNFNLYKTKSTLNKITELIRKNIKMKRTDDPIFSFSIKGEFENNYFKSKDTCFGKGSVFEYIYKKNALIGCLGCSLDRITFVHYVEQKRKVAYRYLKEFSGKVIDKEKKKFKKIKFFVGNLDLQYHVETSSLKKKLEKNNKIIKIPFLRTMNYFIRAKDYYKACKEGLEENEFFLIKERFKFE